MRRRRMGMTGEVELNLAAMLDMAFQLLAFFILTFRPAPSEGDLAMRMPKAAPISQPAPAAPAAATTDTIEPVADLDSLTISALATPDGSLQGVRIAQGAPTINLQQFEQDLQIMLSDPALVFQQVVVFVDRNLRYEEVLRILDSCARQKLGDGSPLTKLSFMELTDDPSATPAEGEP